MATEEDLVKKKKRCRLNICAFFLIYIISQFQCGITKPKLATSMANVCAVQYAEKK